MPTIASLTNVATADNYSDAGATLICQGATGVQVTISNASVAMQLAPRSGGMGFGGWGVEEFQGPQTLTITDDIDGIRFRSFTAGKPARVSVTAFV